MLHWYRRCENLGREAEMTERTGVDAVKVGGERTHEVSNQVGPLVGNNLYTCDRTLSEAVRREGGGWAEAELTRLGGLLGGEEAQRWGFDANENEPVLHTHDAAGNRRDEVIFHPSWHQLMRTSVGARIHSLPWVDARAGAHVARAALLMLTAENELGHTCPISMTFSSVAALRADADLAGEWEPKIISAHYDPSFQPTTAKSGNLNWHGDDGEARRVGCAGEYYAGGALGKFARVFDHRAQMVLLGADVRCVFDFGAGAEGALLFLYAALDFGW